MSACCLSLAVVCVCCCIPLVASCWTVAVCCLIRPSCSLCLPCSCGVHPACLLCAHLCFPLHPPAPSSLSEVSRTGRIRSSSGGPGRLAGTPDYLAPELIEGTLDGPPVDWWAVGMPKDPATPAPQPQPVRTTECYTSWHWSTILFLFCHSRLPLQLFCTRVNQGRSGWRANEALVRNAPGSPGNASGAGDGNWDPKDPTEKEVKESRKKAATAGNGSHREQVRSTVEKSQRRTRAVGQTAGGVGTYQEGDQKKEPK